MNAPTDTRTALWILRGLYDEIDQAYEDTAGEETPDIAALEAFAAEQETDIVEMLAQSFKDSGDRVTALEQRREAIDAKIDAANKHREWCKTALREVMHHRGERRVTIGEHDIAVQKGRERLEMDADVSTECLPDDCIRRVPAKEEPDKRAISARIKEGRQVPGCRLVRGPEVVVVK